MTKDIDQILAAASVVTEILSWCTSLIALYVSAVSGYLLVAYLMGRQLSRLQVSTFTGLFVFFTVFTTASTYSGLIAAHEIGLNYGEGRVQIYLALVTTAIMLTNGVGDLVSKISSHSSMCTVVSRSLVSDITAFFDTLWPRQFFKLSLTGRAPKIF